MEDERLDNRSIKLELSGAFTASELEEIIRTLAGHRSALSPPVPDSPYDMDATPMIDDEGSVIAKPLRDRRVRLWIRNSGIGWFCVHLSQAAAIALRDQFIRATDPTRISNLIHDEPPDRGNLQ